MALRVVRLLLAACTTAIYPLLARPTDAGAKRSACPALAATIAAKSMALRRVRLLLTAFTTALYPLLARPTAHASQRKRLRQGVRRVEPFGRLFVREATNLSLFLELPSWSET